MQHNAKYGGALAVSDGALADCRDCKFVHCIADYGGAVYVGGESTFNVGFTAFYGNQARASGGAVAVMGNSKFECSSCEFDHNEAKGAGGAATRSLPPSVPPSLLSRSQARLLARSLYLRL